MNFNTPPSTRIGTMPTTFAIACGLLALMTTMWAVVNHACVSSLQEDVNDLRQDNTILLENANATAYVFDPTDIAPPNSSGMAVIGITGSGVVQVNNLPPAGGSEVYHLWLVDMDDSTVAAGSLFVSGSGQGFGLIPANSTGYASIAISLERNGGSDTPSGGFLLVAEVNAGRGSQLQPMVARLLCQNHVEQLPMCI